MKRAIIILLLVFIGCQSGKSTKASNKQNIEFSKVPASFELVNNRILLNNGVHFYLDIGAPNIIFNSKPKNFKGTDSIYIGSLINVHKTYGKKIIMEELKNSFFTLKKGVFKTLNNESKGSEIKGSIGPELFQNKTICIDFDRNEIKIMPKKFDSSEYNQAEVIDFDGYYFKIKLKINDIVIVAKLDTGNPYDLILKNNDYQKIKNKESLSYFNSTDKTEKLFHSENNIEIGPKSSNRVLIKSSPSIKRNLIGVGFMKNYNWCLDYKNGKVYYKKLKETTYTL